MTTNPSPSLPCKCRLIRPDGVQRVFFRAESVEDAQRRARRILKKKDLPPGWKLIVDGKAAACFPATQAPTPRAFKVGDDVEIAKLVYGSVFPLGARGKITEIRRNGTIYTDNLGVFTAGTDLIRRVEPAPQPKAEEASTLFVVCRKCGKKCYTSDDHQNHACIEADARTLQRFVNELREMNAAKNEQIENLEAEIATLKAEVERLTGDVKWAKGALETSEARFDHDLETAIAPFKAKLDDIRALHRVMSLAKASPVEDWDFTTLMADVLARG